MRIRHTVIFTFYETTTELQKAEVMRRLNEMGEFLVSQLGVTNWLVATHIPETFKNKRAVELTPLVSDWMTIDTVVQD